MYMAVARLKMHNLGHSYNFEIMRAKKVILASGARISGTYTGVICYSLLFNQTTDQTAKDPAKQNSTASQVHRRIAWLSPAIPGTQTVREQQSARGRGILAKSTQHMAHYPRDLTKQKLKYMAKM